MHSWCLEAPSATTIWALVYAPLESADASASVASPCSTPVHLSDSRWLSDRILRVGVAAMHGQVGGRPHDACTDGPTTTQPGRAQVTEEQLQVAVGVVLDAGAAPSPSPLPQAGWR